LSPPARSRVRGDGAIRRLRSPFHVPRRRERVPTDREEPPPEDREVQVAVTFGPAGTLLSRIGKMARNKHQRGRAAQETRALGKFDSVTDRSRRYMLRLSTAIALAGSMAPLGAQGQEPTPLPEVDVIAPGPLPSTRRLPPKRVRAAPSSASTRAPAQAPQTTVAADPGVIERDKVPANTQVLTPADFSHTQSSNILDSLAKGLTGASLSDQSGNAFQRNLDYRGFTARRRSPSRRLRPPPNRRPARAFRRRPGGAKSPQFSSTTSATRGRRASAGSRVWLNSPSASIGRGGYCRVVS
jgi:hypothetical protein